MKKVGIISIFLAMLVIACSLTVVMPISAESNSSNSSWIMGDTDGDGEISILDATVIQRYLADFEVKYPERVKKCGDINGDGVDILDATLIQRYLAAYTIPYPIDIPIEQPTEQSTEEITDPAFIVETVAANAGDQSVAVNVFVKNNPGVAAIALDISYDKDKLELTGFSYNTAALGGASTTPYSSTAKVPCLFMVNGTSDVTGDFTFATMYFNVKASATGSCPIAVTYEEDNVYDINEDNISFTIINGAIVVGSGGATESVPTDSHTVVFKDENGTVIFSQTVSDGEAATPPDPPEKDGYTFVGWNTEFNNVTGDLEILPVYEKIGTDPAFIVDKVYVGASETIPVLPLSRLISCMISPI